MQYGLSNKIRSRHGISSCLLFVACHLWWKAIEFELLCVFWWDNSWYLALEKTYAVEVLKSLLKIVSWTLVCLLTTLVSLKWSKPAWCFCLITSIWLILEHRTQFVNLNFQFFCLEISLLTTEVNVLIATSFKLTEIHLKCS